MTRSLIRTTRHGDINMMRGYVRNWRQKLIVMTLMDEHLALKDVVVKRPSPRKNTPNMKPAGLPEIVIRIMPVIIFTIAQNRPITAAEFLP